MHARHPLFVHWLRTIALGAWIVGILVPFASVMVVRAAVITVSSTADVIDPTDGVCTLREAIIAANTDTSSGAALGECPAGSGVDTISVPPGSYVLTIPGRDEDFALTGDLDIRSSLMIMGIDANSTKIGASAISGDTGIDRVFHIIGLVSVTIENVTVVNGNPYGGIGSGVGGDGGGILNAGGTLALNGVTVIGNRVPGCCHDGGGIANSNSGTLTMINSAVSNNFADGQGGGIVSNTDGHLTITNSSIAGNRSGSDGGGVRSYFSTTTISGSAVTDNFASDAAGISSSGGSLTLTNSNVSRNSVRAGSGGLGGGVVVIGSATITGATISGNHSELFGGGLYADGSFLGGSILVANSTISGNSSSDTSGRGTGGGLYNQGPVMVVNSTISGNTATTGGGGLMNVSPGSAGLKYSTIAGNSTGIRNDAGGTITVRGTIVANSTAGASCTGTISSADYNLSSDITCAGFSQPHDLTGTNPLLGTLAGNGGPTLTHALLTGSPAVDRIPVAIGCPATDQRGVVRPQGLACDIGAFEALPDVMPPPRPGPSVPGTPAPLPPPRPAPTVSAMPAPVPIPRP